MHVFVYGTLTDPETVGDVLDSYVFVGSAVLHGLHAVDGEYPTLIPGGEVAGRLLRTEQIDRLDEYERVDDDLYTRISVPLGNETGEADEAHDTGENGAGDGDDGDDGGDRTDADVNTQTAAVYVGDPERLDADAQWPGDGSFSDRVRQHVTDGTVWIERGE